ncbi:MAG: GNAT family N-acetyltransferase [Lachnospiraceae bacterium]|jgi:GNAT superfamily N-acetyltransferase|nr:GNAT family N-acetyltransferase [Lachnospiraceae bacterium]
MEQTDLTYFSAENQKEYLALAAEYLPDSEKEKMERRAGRYPRAFVALAIEAELAGVAFGWPRELDAPGDSSFTLDGIAVREPYQRKGYGRLLLRAFESAAGEYGYPAVSVGSAGGYVEKFYLDNGYIPREYKIWTDCGIKVAYTFSDLEDYRNYRRPDGEGFVVLEKWLYIRS